MRCFVYEFVSQYDYSKIEKTYISYTSFSFFLLFLPKRKRKENVFEIISLEAVA
jgi:hypothetical protein